MPSSTTVDRVEVHVLVDNVTDSLSTVPSYVENEWSYLWRKGMKKLSGRCICCAAHGLSCLITAHRGESKHTILFDTGPEEDVFERNVSRLGVDLGIIEGIVLSHGHWDHAGGMLRALDLIRERNGEREVPFYAHPWHVRHTGHEATGWQHAVDGGHSQRGGPDRSRRTGH